MSGKGSGRRPTQIDDKEAEENWNRIFGKKTGYVPLADHFNVLLEDPDGFNEEFDKKEKDYQLAKNIAYQKANGFSREETEKFVDYEIDQILWDSISPLIYEKKC